MNQTTMPTPGQIIERNARFSPQRLALVYERAPPHASPSTRPRAKRLASGLYARGLRRGDRWRSSR